LRGGCPAWGRLWMTPGAWRGSSHASAAWAGGPPSWRWPRFTRSSPVGPTSDQAVRRGLQAILGLGEDEARRVLESLGDYAGLVMCLAAFHYEELKRPRLPEGAG
jgi:hypothetical protein